MEVNLEAMTASVVSMGRLRGPFKKSLRERSDHVKLGVNQA